MSSLKEFESLKNSKQFNYFYNNSKRRHLSCCVVFYKKSDQQQIGFTASKKVGNAIKRNFAKRRLRALFLLNSSKLNNGTYIFVAKKDILDIQFSKLEQDISKALKKLGAYK